MPGSNVAVKIFIEGFSEEMFSRIFVIQGEEWIGRLSMEGREVDDKRVAWVFPFTISPQYIDSGIEVKTTQAAVLFARENRIHELWITMEKDSYLRSKTIFQKLGFDTPNLKHPERGEPEKVSLKTEFSIPLLSKAKKEPDSLRQIREGLVSTYRKEKPHPKIFIHPAFHELRGNYKTKSGKFGFTPLWYLWEIFKKIIKPGDAFLDLGAGHGGIVFSAAALGARATGLETDPYLFELSQRAQETLCGKFKRWDVRLKKGDFFRENFSAYDVLFYYSSGCDKDDSLRYKFSKELRPDAFCVIYAESRKTIPGLTKIMEKPNVIVYRREDS